MLILKRNILTWLAFLFTINGCVERIYFNIPGSQLEFTVEGMISDNPGPYFVKVTKGFSIEADTSLRVPISNLKVRLFDDAGNSDNYNEESPGLYVSSGAIKGQVGRSYYITIETKEGKVFESIPDLLTPTGEIDTIRQEFEARTIVKPYGEFRANVFNIFIDANTTANDDTEKYSRWRFTGTYKVITYPEKNITYIPGYSPFFDPYPCSGYEITPGPEGSGGTLEKKGECSCCICWARDYEVAPQLSDVQFISGNKFNNIKIGEVRITSATFHEKYFIEVEQMSLSRKSFEFFKLVREQKLNAASLFQPPSGEIIGNIRAKNSSDVVIGIFWATSVRKKSKFLYRADVPYPLTPIEFNTKPCYTTYKNSTTIKPAFW
jgi:Domain of unknown function (DUF4249)